MPACKKKETFPTASEQADSIPTQAPAQDQQNIFGDKARKDSLDSIAKMDPKELKAAQKGKKVKGEKTVKEKTVKKSRRTSRSSGS